jgi:hypothetical protein
MKRRTCPTCKGHVFDPVSPVAWFAPFIAYFERKDPRGITRQTCPRCDGKGWVR